MIKTEWRMVPKDRVWALVARLKGRPEEDAGSSLHATEIHVRDENGAVFRFFRAISDHSGIAADDEIEEAYQVEVADPEPVTIDSLIRRVEGRDKGVRDPYLDRDLWLHILGPDVDGQTASPYAQKPSLTRSANACFDLLAEHRPDWRVASLWEIPDGWSVRLTDRVGVAVSPPEDFGRPKIEVRTAEALFKSTAPIAFIIAILKAMKADNYRP